MTRQVLYMGHPLSPTEDEIAAIPRWEPDWDSVRREPQQRERPSGDRAYLALKANLDRALRWLAWLRKSFPETTFIAPWIATVQSLGNDDSPELCEAGLVDYCAVVERCDGIVLCGGRISSRMRREMEHGLAMGLDDCCEPVIQEFRVYDLTKLGALAPTFCAEPAQFMMGSGRRPFPDWADKVTR
jgi:hypothetical protein